MSEQINQEALKNCLLGFDRQGRAIMFPLFVTCGPCNGTGIQDNDTPCPEGCVDGRIPYASNVEVFAAAIQHSPAISEAIIGVIDAYIAKVSKAPE